MSAFGGLVVLAPEMGSKFVTQAMLNWHVFLPSCPQLSSGVSLVFLPAELHRPSEEGRLGLFNHPNVVPCSGLRSTLRRAVVVFFSGKNQK